MNNEYMYLKTILFDLKFGTPLLVVEANTFKIIFQGEYNDFKENHYLKKLNYSVSLISLEDNYLKLEVFKNDYQK